MAVRRPRPVESKAIPVVSLPLVEKLHDVGAPVVVYMLAFVCWSIDELNEMYVFGMDETVFLGVLDQCPKGLPVPEDIDHNDGCNGKLCQPTCQDDEICDASRLL